MDITRVIIGLTILIPFSILIGYYFGYIKGRIRGIREGMEDR